jgi:AraC-like DNA-binding protein
VTCATPRPVNAVAGLHRASKKIEGIICEHPAAGYRMLKVAKALGAGVSTVQRVKAEMPAALER